MRDIYNDRERERERERLNEERRERDTWSFPFFEKSVLLWAKCRSALSTLSPEKNMDKERERERERMQGVYEKKR
jgi:hypothetical protein